MSTTLQELLVPLPRLQVPLGWVIPKPQVVLNGDPAAELVERLTVAYGLGSEPTLPVRQPPMWRSGAAPVGAAGFVTA